MPSGESAAPGLPVAEKRSCWGRMGPGGEPADATVWGKANNNTGCAEYVSGKAIIAAELPRRVMLSARSVPRQEAREAPLQKRFDGEHPESLAPGVVVP